MIFVEKAIVTLTRDAVTIDFDGRMEAAQATITWSPMQASRASALHAQGIHGAAALSAPTLVGRVDPEHGDVNTLDGITRSNPATNFKRIIFVARGTSAPRVAGRRGSPIRGALFADPRSRIDLVVEDSNRDPIVQARRIWRVIAVNQPKRDRRHDGGGCARRLRTLGAGAKVLGRSPTCLEPSIPRLADSASSTPTPAPEIGVASNCQGVYDPAATMALLLAPHLGHRTLTPVRARRRCIELVAPPQKMKDVADGGAQLQVVRGATATRGAIPWSCRGAGARSPSKGRAQASGGIRYIHAEAAAGDESHGPIALDRRGRRWSAPVPRGRTYDKVAPSLMPRSGARQDKGRGDRVTRGSPASAAARRRSRAGSRDTAVRQPRLDPDGAAALQLLAFTWPPTSRHDDDQPAQTWPESVTVRSQRLGLRKRRGG